MNLTPEKIAYLRFRLSHLLEPHPSVESVAGSHLGMQSQIFTAASIGLAVRTNLGTHAELEEKFSNARSLVKTWGQRNTVHLYPADTVPLMVGAFAGESSWRMRQYLKAGGTEQGYRDLLARAADYLHENGTCTREEMSAFLATHEKGFEAIGSWGGILVDLAKQGHLCLGGYDKEAGKQLLYSQPHWNPMLEANLDPGFGPAESNAKLMAMYFSSYGPATLADFCHWRGASLTQAKPWLDLAERESLRAIEVEGQTYYLSGDSARFLSDSPSTASDLPPMLLYRFDPLILAHKDKSWLIEDKHYKKVWRIAAHVEGVLVKQGRIVGVWKFQRKGKSLRFIVHHFRKSLRIGKRNLEKRLQRIAAYLGYADWEWAEEEF